MRENEEEVTIDLLELLRLLWSKAWLLVLLTVLGGAAAIGITAGLITPTYESTTKVYVMNRQDDKALTYSDLQTGTQLTKDYSVLVTSRPVIEETIETLGLNKTYEEAVNMIKVSSQTDTRILVITVTSTSPQVAQMMADQVRDSAAKHIKEVMGIEEVNTVEAANYPDRTAGPSYKKNLVIGCLVGFVLAAAIVIFRYLLDDSIHTPEDVERYLELSILGTIPLSEGEKGKKRKIKKKGGKRS
ncbi:Wzz/FepE/Etk N-terminal domain-containing protein [Cuneatibacter sp. NSJ-177]|uniref:YveK family protein n=1 Tax=Cuneatibacter sp. NSJ-177 TaxID=2931401 RepID=UPI001FD5F55E|nr:Wzz/FepE/Etk N-terminal domain-containing protein [Cuneatibacter sp. NSJ-177]MCJ7834110.1 Wzz/FepE/Etk N-terminal domain-containing protein [Cuneatibacter sp. NSJ-177]